MEGSLKSKNDLQVTESARLILYYSETSPRKWNNSDRQGKCYEGKKQESKAKATMR